MNQKEFESKYEQLIPHAPLQEILNLFEEKKQYYKDSKVSLWIEKLKEKFTKQNTSKFLELGYKNFDSFDFFKKMYDLALSNERADVIEYFFIHNYNSKVVYSFDLANLVVSPKVLKHILNNKELKQTFTEYHYYAMLDKAVWKNKTDSIDIIIESDPEKVKRIEKKLQEKIILQSVYFSSNEAFFKLIKMNEPLKFDINLKQDDFNGINDKRDNLLILAAKNNNLEIMKYLLTSPEIEKHVELAESIFWILNLKNGKEILDTIIFDLNAPLTPELEKLLNEKNSFNPKATELNEQLLEIFKRRDLMLKIDKKLEPKGIKSKPNKI